MSDPDHAVRLAAFDSVRALMDAAGHVTARDLSDGFEFQGVRIPLVNPRRGIFKPRQMRHVLSIKTVFPRVGARVWYDDQREAHRRIYEGVESVEYAFMGSDTNAAENRWLYEAMVERIPIIYFLGVAPGIYHAMIPTFIVGWNADLLKATLAFGHPGEFTYRLPASGDDRRYAMREAKQRLHQTSFREAVLAAYRGRCAFSGLPEPMLLDAAHIVPDAHELYGQPVVPNGLPVSKLHHAAFDRNLIGIDRDYRIHVAGRLLRLRDGPMLEALKGLDGGRIYLPARLQDRPDRERLALRFEQFRSAE